MLTRANVCRKGMVDDYFEWWRVYIGVVRVLMMILILKSARPRCWQALVGLEDACVGTHLSNWALYGPWNRSGVHNSSPSLKEGSTRRCWSYRCGMTRGQIYFYVV